MCKGVKKLKTFICIKIYAQIENAVSKTRIIKEATYY